MDTNRGRRDLFKVAGLMAAGSVIGSALPAAAAEKAAKTVFKVPQITVPIVGSKLHFPVRRINCIGFNYAAHAIEMGNDPTREPPVFFQKNTDAIQLVMPGTTVDNPYPPQTNAPAPLCELRHHQRFTVRICKFIHYPFRGLPNRSQERLQAFFLLAAV